jgi:tetratricopeptide (TPR) repeat protein
MRIGSRIVVVPLAAALLLAAGAIVAHRSAPQQLTPIGPGTGHELPLSVVMPAGDLATTIANLQQRLRAFPTDASAATALGLAYVQQARITADPTLYPLAEGELQHALAIGSRDDPSALVGMGTLALARHDFAGALVWGERARAIAPFDADVYGVIGDAQVELGRYRAAVRTFQTMVDTRPDLASYARVSYIRELEGDVAGAASAMRDALNAAGTPDDQAWCSYQLGELAFGQGNVSVARGWYQRARALAPDYVPPIAGLAKVAWARGHVAAAIVGYREVVQRYPAPEYVIALTDLYRTTGRDRLAQRTERLVRVEERLFRANGVNVDLELSLFEADHGRPDAAVTTARAEWHRRHSVHVADAFAWSLSQAGHDRAAARIIGRALSQGTRNALFYFHDAMIRLRLGEDHRTETLLSYAISINPNFSILYRDRAASLLVRLESS